MTLAPQAIAAADRLADAFQARRGQPGLAYGIVAGGRLAHARGLGERRLGGAVPDAGTVFRIASMTKSFTAAAVLLLRADGKLSLDSPAAAYLPELAGPSPAPGSGGPTVRQLLTMTAGLPTDDPWGDRQQGLPLGDFTRLLRGGLSYAWPPGTRFEYSNLGYAILGAVITATSGMPYPDFVARRLLRPLGLSGTGFDAVGFGAERLACGYSRSSGGWSEQAPDPCGAFASMGGLFSCVADLARWVAGFTAAFAPADRDRAGHPLPAAARREMQLPQVAMAPSALVPLPGGAARDAAAGYGFGLTATEDPVWGRVVGHSGGYPGFGSHMCWHPASGLGVIALANSTYAAASVLASRLLDAVLRHTVPGPGGPGEPPAPGGGPGGPAGRAWPRRCPLAPGGPWKETLAAREAVTGLLQRWDDAIAGRLFSPNVAQDEPYPQRRRKAELAAQRIGGLRDHTGRPHEFDSPAHCRWWLAGGRGSVQAEILLTPEAPPRVQSLRLAVPPAAGSPLAEAVATLVALLNGGTAGWPSSLAASAWLDTGLAVRQFRMAAGWAGQCVPGAFRAGDGETTVTVELDGEHARLALTVAIDPATGLLHQADIQLAP